MKKTKQLHKLDNSRSDSKLFPTTVYNLLRGFNMQSPLFLQYTKFMEHLLPVQEISGYIL